MRPLHHRTPGNDAIPDHPSPLQTGNTPTPPPAPTTSHRCAERGRRQGPSAAPRSGSARAWTPTPSSARAITGPGQENGRPTLLTGPAPSGMTCRAQLDRFAPVRRGRLRKSPLRPVQKPVPPVLQHRLRPSHQRRRLPHPAGRKENDVRRLCRHHAGPSRSPHVDPQSAPTHASCGCGSWPAPGMVGMGGLPVEHAGRRSWSASAGTASGKV